MCASTIDLEKTILRDTHSDLLSFHPFHSHKIRISHFQTRQTSRNISHRSDAHKPHTHPMPDSHVPITFMVSRVSHRLRMNAQTTTGNAWHGTRHTNNGHPPPSCSSLFQAVPMTLSGGASWIFPMERLVDGQTISHA